MNTEAPKLNQLAADMARQQIAAYDSEITRLDEQIRNIEARKVAIRLMRDTLAPLVAPSQGPTSSPTPAAAPTKGALTGPTGPAPASVGAAPPPVAHIGNGAITSCNASIIATATHHPTSTGFSAAVREILHKYPKGLRPQEVAKEMQQSGHSATYTGKTPFGVRVGNELNRLMKSGVIQRRSGRYFFGANAGSATAVAR